MTRRTLTLLALLAGSLATACHPGGAAREAEALTNAGSVGSSRCAPCHAAVHAQWTASQHARGFRVASIEDEDRLSSIVPCSDMSVSHVLGERHHVRFLIENADTPWGQGRFLALPCGWDVHGKQLQMHHAEDWRTRPLENTCAPCHVTRQRADWSWDEPGVGCESCHGDGARHVEAPSKSNIVTFAGKSAAEEVTICASCHLQGGKSARTGLPFPDGFVPGGPLFDDYQFDWASLDQVDPNEAIDVHQKLLIRSLALGPSEPGASTLRCSSCHALHDMSHEKHSGLPRETFCLTCHQPESYLLKEYRQSCPVCEF